MSLESIINGSCTSYLEIHALLPPSIMSSCHELYAQYQMSLLLPYPRMRNAAGPQAKFLILMFVVAFGTVFEAANNSFLGAVVVGMFFALYG